MADRNQTSFLNNQSSLVNQLNNQSMQSHNEQVLDIESVLIRKADLDDIEDLNKLITEEG